MTYREPPYIPSSQGFVAALLCFLQDGDVNDVEGLQDRYSCLSVRKRDVCLAKKFILEQSVHSKNGS